MSKSRNRLLRRTAILMLPLFALAVGVPHASESQKEQTGKPKVSQRKAKEKSTKDEKKVRDEKYIPSEKVSAGKSLSFPADI